MVNEFFILFIYIVVLFLYIVIYGIRIYKWVHLNYFDTFTLNI